MGFFKRYFSRGAHASASARAEYGDSATFYSINDPQVLEFFRTGVESITGASVTVETAMRNTALFRAVTLIASSIGMLPLQLIHDDTKQKATDHPLYRLLHREPNSWQTAFDFRSLMQLRALVYGNAFALIIRSFDIRSGKPVIKQLVPLDPAKMEVKQNPDWSVVYNYQPQQGQRRSFKPEDIFHLRGVSIDGLNGLSLVRQARDALGLAISAELAAGRLFKNGSFIGGALKHPGKLSPEAFERLKASLAEKEGAENAGKNLILEEGMDFTGVSSSARDAQMLELRKMQVEEVARVTGVPRPLLGVDDTSWGSGIEALGRFFVQYALGAWFEAWQQAVERSLLTDAEKDGLSAKYNAGALLRGSIKDQADFFAKALGAGGAAGWMTQNEARDLQDMPRVEGGDTVSKGAMMNFSGTKNGAKDDEP